MAKGNGSWLPLTVAECLPRLRLRPSSRSQVFLAVLIVWCRFGCGEARLSILDISTMTGLAPGTVKGALADLLARGLLKRLGRYKRLAVDVKALRMRAGPPATASSAASTSGGRSGGKGMRVPPRDTQGITSPTSSYVSVSKKDKGRSRFTPKQVATIRDVMVEARGLLGSDPYALEISPASVAPLGVPIGTTFGTAMRALAAGGTGYQRGKFVAAVLGLRQDPRIQGTELTA